MIASTETATNVNNAFLATEIQKNKKSGVDYSYVQGISGGARVCPWCRSHVDGKVFVVVDRAPNSGDRITIDGKAWTAIWPGKSNYGRNRANWWVASGAQHPHCNCSFVTYVQGFDQYYDKLWTKIKKESRDDNSIG